MVQTSHFGKVLKIKINQLLSGWLNTGYLPFPSPHEGERRVEERPFDRLRV